MRITDALRYRPIVGCDLADDGRRVAIAYPRYVPGQPERPVTLEVADLDAPSLRWTRPAPDPAVRSRYQPVFAPDGRRLACFQVTGTALGAALLDAAQPDRPATVLASLPPAAAALKWRGPDPTCLGEDPAGYRRVFAWADPGRPPVPLTAEGVHAGDFAFSPGGARLAWLPLPPLGLPGQPEPPTPLHVTDADGRHGRTVRLPNQPLGWLAWSLDGRLLAWLGRSRAQRLSTRQLWVASPDDPSTARCPTRALPGWITGFDWLPDASGLVVAVVQGTYGRLYRCPLDGPPTPLGPRERYLSAPHGDRSRGRLAFLDQDGGTPQRLCLLEPGAARARPLTRLHRSLPAGLRPAETVTWTAVDGTRLDGVLVRPAAPGPAPLVVWLHGGPAEHVARTFSPYFQTFAAAGYAVFAPNYRGSTGRDDAFLRASVGDLGGADGDDVLSGIDRLVQMDVADPGRAALVGWSYGATLALLLATRSSLFRAVVAGAPVADWVSFFGSPQVSGVYGEYFGAPLWEDRAPYDRASPISHARRLDVPTLLLHGGADPIVPPAHARLLYRALAAREVPTDLMVYPAEGHVLSGSAAVSDMLERMLDWLGRYV